MPEAMIIYRFHYKGNGIVDEWWDAFSTLSEEQIAVAKPIIHTNIFNNFEDETNDPQIRNVLKFYRITRDDAEKASKRGR